MSARTTALAVVLAAGAVVVWGCGAPTCGQATAALDKVDADIAADAVRWADEAHAELDAEGVPRFDAAPPTIEVERWAEFWHSLTAAERGHYDARRAVDAYAADRATAEHRYRRIDADHQRRASCAL